MGNPPKTRKRVHAIRRGQDGSAFERCDDCGLLVAIALADMHECGAETKRIVKRFKDVNGKQKIAKHSYSNQPRSPFVAFMEEFRISCNEPKLFDIYREGFETWIKMSEEERKPYVIKAEKINSAYVKSLIQEIDDSSEMDDEADSLMVGKFESTYKDYGYQLNTDCSSDCLVECGSFWNCSDYSSDGFVECGNFWNWAW